MMRNVFVKHFETGLLIYQKGMRNMLVIPNELKTNFYETMLTACMNGKSFSWADLEDDEMSFHYEYKNKFNCFINGCYCGDMSFILLSNESVAIPVETDGTFDYFEVYDSRIMECYLLEKEEVLRLTK